MGVADHHVINQGLISSARFLPKIIGVSEFQVDCSEIHARSWHLGFKSQANAFVRLQVHDQLVRRQFLNGGLAEQREPLAPA